MVDEASYAAVVKSCDKYRLHLHFEVIEMHKHTSICSADVDQQKQVLQTSCRAQGENS